MKQKPSDHPFPNEELNLIMKLQREEKITSQELETISNLLAKYLDLRADAFHDF